MLIARRSALAAVVAAAGIGVMSALPAGASQRMCANAPGGDVVSATNTSCREAHKVMRLWLAGVRRDGQYNRKVGKWRCRNQPSSVEGDTMVCRKGKRQRVTWYVNIPQ